MRPLLVTAFVIYYSACSFAELGEIVPPKFVDADSMREVVLVDSLARARNDKIFVIKNDLIPSALSFVLCAPYDQVLLNAKIFIEKKLNLASVEGQVFSVVSLPSINSHAKVRATSDSAGSSAENTLPLFRARGVKLTTGKLHVDVIEEAYSEVIWTVFDGVKVYDNQSTVLVVSRVDHTLERLRTFHLRIPLPFKRKSKNWIVSQEEYKLIEEFGEELGGVLAGYAASESYYADRILVNPETLDRLRNISLEQCGRADG